MKNKNHPLKDNDKDLIEELIKEYKYEPEAKSFLRFCSKMINIAPKPKKDFKNQLKENLIQKNFTIHKKTNEKISRAPIFSQVTNFIYSITYFIMKNSRKIAFTGVSVFAFMLAIVGYTTLSIQAKTAHAQEIIQNNSQVHKLIEYFGLEREDVQVEDNIAKVSFQTPGLNNKSLLMVLDPQNDQMAVSDKNQEIVIHVADLIVSSNSKSLQGPIKVTMPDGKTVELGQTQELLDFLDDNNSPVKLFAGKHLVSFENPQEISEFLNQGMPDTEEKSQNQSETFFVSHVEVDLEGEMVRSALLMPLDPETENPKETINMLNDEIELFYEKAAEKRGMNVEEFKEDFENFSLQLIQ